MDYYVGVFQRFFMLCFTNLQTGICEEKKTQKEKGKKHDKEFVVITMPIIRESLDCSTLKATAIQRMNSVVNLFDLYSSDREWRAEIDRCSTYGQRLATMNSTL
jgi:hypothetical protein